MNDKPTVTSIWFFDSNQRRYRKDANGNSFSNPIWRDHWREIRVIGETRQSYLLGLRLWLYGKAINRVSKKEVAANNTVFALNPDAIDRQALRAAVDRHAGRLIRRADDATIAKIAELLKIEAED